MRNRLKLAGALCLLLLAASCDKGDEGGAFPSMWNEIVSLVTDGQGRIRQLVTDNGDTYEVTNHLAGYKAGTTYRTMCGYSTEGGKATLYQTIGVYMLHDSTAQVSHDPLKVLSAWRSDGFINMHLAPLTQGGLHTWGYALDSISNNGRHLWLSLHHRQGTDPLSYTQETYASIQLDNVTGTDEADSISLSIHTFNGIHTWNFKK